MEDLKSSEFFLSNCIERAKQGDNDAFTLIIESIKIKLYKTGIAILKNDDDTCDALQDTLINIYNNLKTLRDNSYFTTWSIRIMINNCYEIIRKRKKIVDIEERKADQEDIYYQSYKEESELEWVLNRIDPDLKTVTILYYYDDLSVSEIAETLNIPEGTVKSRLSRAREKLYSILKEKEGEE